VGEKRLVGGDDNVWEREQPGKFIIKQDLALEVLEEHTFFLFIKFKPTPPSRRFLRASIGAHAKTLWAN
jgi:hypothetical protein